MKYIIIVLLLIISIPLQAAPTCSKNGTIVIYTNGVITKKGEAEIARRTIRDLALNSQIDLKPEKVKYVLVHNYSESLSLDVMESAVQKLPQSYIDELKVKNAYEAYSYFLQGKLISSISSVIIDSINQNKLELIRSFAIDYYNDPLYSQTLSKIYNYYQSTFSSGKRVFAISHSQGSLFMRDVWNLLPEGDSKRKYFSGFQIASVLGSKMDSHFGYATHEKDAVVNLVRGAISALPANLETPFFINSGFGDDLLLNHGILSTYLNDSTIKPQVISRLIATAQLLESNCLKAVINYTKNNLVVNFNSTDLENPDVTGLTYSWNFGDGQTASTTSKIFSHTYAQGGSYSVSLTIKDEFGTIDTETVTVNLSSDIFPTKVLCEQHYNEANGYHSYYGRVYSIGFKYNGNGELTSNMSRRITRGDLLYPDLEWFWVDTEERSTRIIISDPSGVIFDQVVINPCVQGMSLPEDSIISI